MISSISAHIHKPQGHPSFFTPLTHDATPAPHPFLEALDNFFSFGNRRITIIEQIGSQALAIEEETKTAPSHIYSTIAKMCILSTLIPSITILALKTFHRRMLVITPADEMTIQLHKNPEMTYRGSNAEYIIIPDDNASELSFEEYVDHALPILNKRFPRTNDNDLSEEELDALDTDENKMISSQLSSLGYSCFALPKTLYDLFYIYFRTIDFMKAYSPRGDNDDGSKPFLAIDKEIIDDLNNKDIETIWDMLEDTKLSCDLPPLPFSIPQQNQPITSSFICSIYTKREYDDRYRRVLYRLNRRISDYFYTHGVDSKNPLTWRSTKHLFENIYSELSQAKVRYHHSSMNKTTRGVGEYCTFARLSPFMIFYKSFFDEYSNDLCRLTVLQALKHEFMEDPACYLIYRTGNLSFDSSNDETKTPISYSFSHSALGGLQYDHETGSVIGCKYNHPKREVYALPINKHDYRLQPAVREIVHIPEARGPNRVVSTGEFGHVRTKIAYPLKDSEWNFEGVNYRFISSRKRRQFEYLTIRQEPGSPSRECQKKVDEFIRSHHKILMPPEHE